VVPIVVVLAVVGGVVAAIALSGGDDDKAPTKTTVVAERGATDPAERRSPCSSHQDKRRSVDQSSQTWKSVGQI